MGHSTYLQKIGRGGSPQQGKEAEAELKLDI